MQEETKCHKCGQVLISVEPVIEGAVGVIFKTEKKGMPRGKFFTEEFCLNCSESRGVATREYPGDGE
jgi:nitrate/TMAO reductase-like tetraheme cytochrome c subunit